VPIVSTFWGDPAPVLAAGGIADARGVSAALALGAQGASIGTRSPLVRYRFGLPASGTSGDVESMAMYAGQGVGLIHASQPAAHIVRALMPTG
jgi:hypothetical protein